MRRFFLFAVLWTALFGPGHVLAACPMASAAGHGSHAPCHSDENRTAPRAEHGHDCCAWVASSSGSGKFFTQKSDGPFGELAPASVAVPVFVGWHAPPLIRPPPLLRTSRYLPATSGGDTFLRTSRLRL
jgi:hypothetical protein